jgi:hypothetical protein
MVDLNAAGDLFRSYSHFNLPIASIEALSIFGVSIMFRTILALAVTTVIIAGCGGTKASPGSMGGCTPADCAACPKMADGSCPKLNGGKCDKSAGGACDKAKSSGCDKAKADCAKSGKAKGCCKNKG